MTKQQDEEEKEKSSISGTIIEIAASIAVGAILIMLAFWACATIWDQFS